MDFDLTKEVEAYTKHLTSKDVESSENAYHSLLEMGQEAIPILITIYSSETNPGIKSKIVEVIWQCRSASSVPFLGRVLRDVNSDDWKQALTGLAAIASADALKELQMARQGSAFRGDRVDFCEWVDEAIQQIQTDQHS